MKVLPNVKPKPEQLKILARDARSLLIVRGAAGSGKTTTALLRLKFVVDFWQQQAARAGNDLKVLVLTFNRTLAGYVEALANEQVKAHKHVSVEVETFDKWALEQLGNPSIVDYDERERKIVSLGAGLGLGTRFLVDEVAYATGRFLPGNLSDYLTVSRDGRGVSPPMPKKLRERLLTEVIAPLTAWKKAANKLDFGDLAIELAQKKVASYDVIVVDETQDFEANRLRAVLNQAANPSSLTFVLDATQRIYPHAFRWKEVNINPAGAVQTLTRNYRNTKQIAAFAKPLVDGLDVGDDGSIPDFNAASTNGPLPTILAGLFGAQMAWAVGQIKKNVNLATESVAFLHPLGHGWFKEVRAQLKTARLAYCELTRTRTYPLGPTNIALSTMYSAKGLEFDHVFILGLNDKVMEHGSEDGDVELEKLRRLLAMAIGRARLTVTLGYKPGEESDLLKLLDPSTYSLVKV